MVCPALTEHLLTVTPPNPSAGQVVTLTATVTSVGNVVDSGTVTFLSGKQSLATVQLNKSNGIAVLSTRFGPGTYTLTARYNGTNSFQASDSSPQMLIVTGTEPTISLLTATPDGQNYDFNLSVFGDGFAALSGNATLNEVTQNGLLLGTIAVPGPGTLSYQTASNYPAGVAPYLITSGDFNNDGFPDVAVSNGDTLGDTVTVLLNKGDGTFGAPEVLSVPSGPLGIANADFNGDGNLDLAVARFLPPNAGVSVLFGNGDGTFQPQQFYQVGEAAAAVVVGDFNNDGFPDLAVADDSGFVSVLLNQGDGTFNILQETFPAGTEPIAITTGDFNRDGILDLAVADFHNQQVAVLLGNGDGTFQPATFLTVGNFPFDIATGDLNNDDQLDLVVTNSQDGTVSVLLGNGDGTFQPQNVVMVGNGPSGVVIADLNGDGIPDLAVSTGLSNGNTVTVLLGNGDGTFQPPQAYPIAPGAQPVGLVSADFNGDGVPDLTAANHSQDAVGVLLGGTLSAGQLLNVPVSGQGDQMVQSTFTPDGTFYASSQSQKVDVIGHGSPTTTIVTSSPNPSVYLQPVTFTATVTAVGGVPTGTVTFTDSSNNNFVLCNHVLLNGEGIAVCSNITSLAVGTHLITASYSGDGNFNLSSGTVTQQVNPLLAVITITPYSVTYDGKAHIATGTAKCGMTDVSADLDLSKTMHTNAGDYAQDLWSFHDPKGNCIDASGTVHDTIVQAATTTSLAAAPPSPARFGQSVTFVATVTGSGGGSPTGSVSFTDNQAPIPGCAAVALVPQQSGSTATCQTSSLAVGSHAIATAYGGDGNFGPSASSISYIVGAAGADFTVLPISPASAMVTQGFSNNNDPFFAQAISVTVQPMPGYVNTVTVSCSVSPPLNSGSCTVNAPSSGSLASGSLNTTLTISAGDATPIGSYTVTVSAQDSNQVVHTANLALAVIEQTPSTVMPSGGGTTTQVNFPGAPNTQVGGFSCPSVSGTGINGTEAFSAIGGVCTFTPGSITLPAPVTVTLSGCSVPVARLRRQSPIFASVFFGLPAVVLLGPLFRRHRNQRRKLQRVVILFLLTLGFLMFGFGCGGSAGPLTPTGHYYVLVQGTGPGGTTYSAVVPLTVTP